MKFSQTLLFFFFFFLHDCSHNSLAFFPSNRIKLFSLFSTIITIIFAHECVNYTEPFCRFPSRQLASSKICVAPSWINNYNPIIYYYFVFFFPSIFVDSQSSWILIPNIISIWEASCQLVYKNAEIWRNLFGQNLFIGFFLSPNFIRLSKYMFWSK